MKHVLWPAFGNVGLQTLQSRSDSSDGAVMVGSLLINNALETPIPLVVVVRHIGNKVGVATLALSHNTVFVIAKISCA